MALDVSRREFIVGSSAGMLAAGALGDESPDSRRLFVEVARENGEITAVRLVFRGPDDSAVIARDELNFRLADFAPVPDQQSQRPRLRVRGLTAAALDVEGALLPSAVLTIAVEGVELFRHPGPQVGGRKNEYRFDLFSVPAIPEAVASPAWHMRLVSNVWLHPWRRTALSFPGRPGEPNSSFPLRELMAGDRGFWLVLGAGWVAHTLLISQEYT